MATEERNPKKSKAVIITFVIVLLLLIGGYLLLTQTNVMTKNGVVGKVFAPLLGTSKQKNVSPIQNVNNNNGAQKNTATATANGIQNTNENNGGGNTTEEPFQPYSPIPSPIPYPTPDINPSYTCQDSGADNFGGDLPCVYTGTTKTQCEDGIDNDGDKLIDDKDPGCHTDYNASNTLSYDATLNDESAIEPAPEIQCPDLTLNFTPEEQKQLDDLTRQYYHLSATLHSQDDVFAEIYAKKSYEDLVAKAKDLTNQCVSEVQPFINSKPGPHRQRLNPFYDVSNRNVTEWIDSWAIGVMDDEDVNVFNKGPKSYVSNGAIKSSKTDSMGGKWVEYLNTTDTTDDQLINATYQPYAVPTYRMADASVFSWFEALFNIW